MIHEAPPPAPPLVAATEAVTPSPDLPPRGEAVLPAPTVEQARVVDGVFTAAPSRDPLASLLGAGMCLLLLHDVAVDTFATSGEDEAPEQNAGADDDADSAD